MNLLAKLILKDFRVSFLYFFIQKRCWRTSPTSKSIEPFNVTMRIVDLLIAVFFLDRFDRRKADFTGGKRQGSLWGLNDQFAMLPDFSSDTCVRNPFLCKADFFT